MKLLAALVGTALCAAAPAARATANTTTTAYPVPADGTPVVTLHPSIRDRTYQVTVDGLYWYGDGTGLADCGHYSKPGPAVSPTWTHNVQLRIDGAQARCGRQPLNDQHHYTFTVTGTGKPFQLDVLDWGGGRDNVGALVVRLSPLV